MSFRSLFSLSLSLSRAPTGCHYRSEPLRSTEGETPGVFKVLGSTIAGVGTVMGAAKETTFKTVGGVSSSLADSLEGSFGKDVGDLTRDAGGIVVGTGRAVWNAASVSTGTRIVMKVGKGVAAGVVTEPKRSAGDELLMVEQTPDDGLPTVDVLDAGLSEIRFESESKKDA